MRPFSHYCFIHLIWSVLACVYQQNVKLQFYIQLTFISICYFSVCGFGRFIRKLAANGSFRREFITYFPSTGCFIDLFDEMERGKCEFPPVHGNNFKHDF